MEKTEMMKRYEAETGFTDAIVMVKIGITKLYFPSMAYVQWVEERFAKSEAKSPLYNRLMSGGNKTLKEWANMFGMAVAVDQNGEASCFGHVPVMWIDEGEGIWANSPNHYGKETYLLPPYLIDFDGDWKDSLTLPDGWEEK